MFFILGTAEQYTELDALIQDLSERQAELDINESNKGSDNKRRADGSRIREIAMQRLKDKNSRSEVTRTDDTEDGGDDSESNPSVGSTSPAPDIPTVKRRKSSGGRGQNELIDYMRERDMRNAELRREELAIERMKAETKLSNLICY